MPGFRLLVLLPGAACFLGFSWGTLKHFRPVGPVPRGMRFVEAVSIVMVAVFAWLVLERPLSMFWPAAPILCLVSLALFVWAVRTTRDAGFALAFTGTPPPAIVTSGPFRHVRHPFYTSYLIFWFATCIATMSRLSWAGSIILLMCYVVAARKEEQHLSRGQLAAEYARYASQTGMFLPRLLERRQNLGPRDFET